MWVGVQYWESSLFSGEDVEANPKIKGDTHIWGNSPPLYTLPRLTKVLPIFLQMFGMAQRTPTKNTRLVAVASFLNLALNHLRTSEQLNTCFPTRRLDKHIYSSSSARQRPWCRGAGHDLYGRKLSIWDGPDGRLYLLCLTPATDPRLTHGGGSSEDLGTRAAVKR